MTEQPSTVDGPQADAIVLTESERTWLQNQYRKETGQTSKYVRHQGQAERARRLKKGSL